MRLDWPIVIIAIPVLIVMMGLCHEEKRLCEAAKRELPAASGEAREHFQAILDECS